VSLLVRIALAVALLAAEGPAGAQADDGERDGTFLVEGRFEPAGQDLVIMEADTLDVASFDALVAADHEVDSIAARLRQARSRVSRTSLLPRVAFTLALVRGSPSRVDREAGFPDTRDLQARAGLTWSIVASWGGR
jgi:hypothetical protein